VPEPGQRIRCERCQGPVFLEDLQPAPPAPEPIRLPTSRKKARRSSAKAA
jgi:hypothetical protein